MLEVDYLSKLPSQITTDDVRLRQVITNLVGNAIKFTSKGKVTISTRLIGEQNKQLEVSIQDSGIGMTSEQLTRIFDPFVQADSSVTRKFGGTGLGLAISKRIVESLGGKIFATSDAGKGSTFTFTINIGNVDSLPLITYDQYCETVKQRVRSHETITRLPAGRILVVDDGDANRRLIKLILEKAGCTVDEAENGELGVEKASATEFDLILMDMQMPVMDGYKATAAIRKRKLNVPVIALTANAMAGDREKCLAAGCDDFLAKPVQIDEVLRTVGDYLAHLPISTVVTESPQPDGAVAQPSIPNAASKVDFNLVLQTRLIEFQQSIENGDLKQTTSCLLKLKDECLAAGRQKTAKQTAELLDACKNLDEQAIKAALTGLIANAQNEIAKTNQVSQPRSGSRSQPLAQSAAKSPDAQSATNASRPNADDQGPIFSQLPTEEPEFRSIVEDFVPQLKLKLDEMDSALAAGDMTEMASLAHWLKGAGGTVGFTQFGVPSFKLETAARESNLEEAAIHLGAIKNLQQRIALNEAPAAV